MRRQLRDARAALNLTQEQVAHRVGVDRTTIGTWERGEATPAPGHQRASYADALGMTVSELHAALSNMPRNGDDDMPTDLKVALALEQAATEIRAHELCVVYGLLQTPDYAAEIARTVGTTETSDDYVQRNMDQRRHRQQRVLGGHVDLHVVQPEAAVRLQLGDRSVMAAQMRHLVDVAQRPNVTLQIVPFSAGQYEAQRIGIFAMNFLPWAATPTVDLDAYGGLKLIDDPDEVAYFADAFDHACKVALSPAASATFLDQLAHDWEDKP